MNERFPNLINFLPGIFHKGISDKEEPLHYGILKIFEEGISGSDSNETGRKSFAEMLNIIGELFFPCSGIFSGKDNEFNKHFHENDNDYLQWLASLMALVIEENWPIEKKRIVISRIIPLYRMRGTKKGLEEYLNIYVNGEASIVEEQKPLQVEKTATVSVDTVIGGLPHHFFIVNLTLAITNPGEIKKEILAVKKIVDAEKPVHTEYKINTITPSFELEVNSTVEIDTLLSMEL